MRHCGIDSRPATPPEPVHLLVAIGLVLAVNTARPSLERSRGRRAFHDGQASRVTRLDVALSAAFSVAALAASAYEWWLAR